MISFKDELLNPTWALRISFQKEIFQVKPNRDSPSTLSSDSSKGPGTERQFLTTPSPQPYPITTLKGLEGGPLILRGGPHDVPWRHLRFRISGSQENQDIVYPAELCLFCCLVALGCFICSCCSCFFPSHSYFFLLLNQEISQKYTFLTINSTPQFTMFDAIKNWFSPAQENENKWDARNVELQQPNSPAGPAMNSEAVTQQPV